MAGWGVDSHAGEVEMQEGFGLVASEIVFADLDWHSEEVRI